MLVYLDIDGVMVPANSWRRPEILEDGFPEFSPMATKALNRIISNLSADIVLTTSHKSNYSLYQWKNIFKRRNINFNRISKLPENKNHLNRKDELLKWFTTRRRLDNFIIIDDDKSLNALPYSLKEKLIQTNGGIGLTDYLADKAINTIENSNHVIA
jgi:hypothetical protein